PAIGLYSDSSWRAAKHLAFRSDSPKPHPNWRLSESNIFFDARDATSMQTRDAALFAVPTKAFQPCTIIKPKRPLSAQLRPIPQWKDFGLQSYANKVFTKRESDGDTIVLELPYNMQFTPYFEIEAEAGDTIDIRTDNYNGGRAFNVRCNYVTQSGRQIFESPGWMNGHSVRYYFPKGIKILDLRFRESGYQTEFTKGFACEDEFYNQLWEKAVRTLYITMRDNYMDCPDRERGQWWGDVVLEMGETFYALDRQSDALSRKAILELMNFQRPDSTIFSPIPAGNWDNELPTQMLASVGYYGIWTYYWHTGDRALIAEVYPRVKKYLGVWKTDERGLVVPRKGGWLWGDWGENKDMALLFNGWYYLALKGQAEMARLLGETDDLAKAEASMKKLKTAFNEVFWNGTVYKSAVHKGEPDDRGNALAVVAGLAPEAYFSAIKKLLVQQQKASPYFEKYVEEALFQMGYPEAALTRMKQRFGPMVASELTTLWEGWDIGSATWGGGTYNHAWSGGGLTLMAEYVAGVRPSEAGYSKIRIAPQLGFLERASLDM
ncbi:MAG: glycoside hydrolase, partial [Bacteroidota bacterium]